MKHTHLYVVRHGRTDWNAEDRIQGTVDRPLDEVGREEAKKLASVFAYTPIEAIYSSPLLRARQTAEIFSEYTPCPTFYDASLREIGHGLLEGKKWHEYREEYRDKIEHYKRLPRKDRLHFKYTDLSESIYEVLGRVIPCLQKMCVRHAGKHILVVTHGGVMKQLFSHLNDFDDTRVKVHNTGYFWMSGAEGKLYIHKHEGLHLQ